MNPLAEELNAVLDGTVAGRLLSRLGRRFYFPQGIIAQSAEAREAAYTANATIGMAYHNGQPLTLPATADNLPLLSAQEAVSYAPTAGVEAVRRIWKKELLRKNPSLKDGTFCLPIVAPGITAGISYTADLFLDEDQVILSSSPCWDNYGLIFSGRREAQHRGIPLFNGGGLDLALIRETLRREAAGGTLRIILNFPNNPSGYSPTRSEAAALIAEIRELAEGGTDLLVICDDAYFNLFYEEDSIHESLFSALADLHERVLTVKVDGPTKEDYAWGFRMAFVSFGSRGLNDAARDALVKKYMGIIRSTVSCANTPAQYLMLKTLEDHRSAGEKARFFNLLKNRYRAVKDFIAATPPHPALSPLPFNSGYFMSFRCEGFPAEELRRELLANHGIGTIALEERYLRITFAAIEAEAIPGIFRTIYETASKLLGKKHKSEVPVRS